MKFATRSPRTAEVTPPGVIGTARVDRRTHDLLPRLQPGDVAVIDHLDLDRATAHQLVDAGVAAVINASAMISGRYATLGPEVLARAGVPMLDQVGPEVLHAVRDGARVRIHDGLVYVDDEPVAAGQELDSTGVDLLMREARDGMTAHLSSFTHNSSEFLRREQDLLLHGRGLPGTRTTFRHRPVVVVVAGHEHREELAGARRFIREARPVLVGVDRGADALLAAGHTPDVVVISGTTLPTGEAPTSKALKAASDVVVRVDRGTPTSATASLRRLGVHPLHIETGATGEDAALVLAQRGGASVIVGVGMHATLDEFLDRHRPGLASTFLTRLSVGPTLVDATAIPELYTRHRRRLRLLVACLALLVVAGAAVAATPVGRDRVADLRADLGLRAEPAAAAPAPVHQRREEPAPADPRPAYADSFAAAAAARLYGDGLAGRGVALVTLPGADDAAVQGLVDQVDAAGGVVTARVALTEGLLAPGEKSLVDTLGSQVAQQLTDTEVPAEATAYDRFGALAGAAVATRKRKGAESGSDTRTILESLSGAGLAAPGELPRTRAQLVVLVLGTDAGESADRAVGGLVAGLATQTRSLVVVGDVAAGVDGDLARLRGQGVPDGVTTVDGVDTGAGRVTVALALLRSLESPGGAFGASGADGAVPVG